MVETEATGSCATEIVVAEPRKLNWNECRSGSSIETFEACDDLAFFCRCRVVGSIMEHGAAPGPWHGGRGWNSSNLCSVCILGW